jgi:phosphoglycolate phosphatase
MKIDLVIFDKDGTLIDIHCYWGGMVKLRSEALSKKYIKPQFRTKVTNELMFNMGINLETGKIKPKGPVGINPREVVIDAAYQTVKKYCCTITLDQVSSVFNEIDEYSKKHLDQLVVPLPGVKELLTELRLKKIKMAIATTDLTNRAKLAVKSIGIDKYFDRIVGADLVDKTKPSPDLVDYICRSLSVNKANTVVVGDSIVDLKMSEAANVRFVGVKTGLYSPKFIKGSEVLINNLEDMSIIL